MPSHALAVTSGGTSLSVEKSPEVATPVEGGVTPKLSVVVGSLVSCGLQALATITSVRIAIPGFDMTRLNHDSGTNR